MTISAVQRRTWADVDDAVVTVDEDGIITSWNAAAERLLGHRADTAVGQSLTLIIPMKHQYRHSVGFHKAMASAHLTKGARPARVLAKTVDGRIMPLVMTLALLGPDGAPEGVIAVLRRLGYAASST